MPAYNPNWIEFDTVRASQTGSTSFAQLTADWLVPAVPPATYASSQVYFTFPGLEDGHYIIQPVIQYGFSAAGGGNFWSMASWQCHGGSDCFHAPETVVSISAGDTIHGSVVASNCSNGTCTWTITGETSSASAVFTTTGLESYNWATGGAVEVYNLTTCNHYPLDGVFYTNISLYDQNMNLLSSPPWGGYVEPSIPPNVSPSCGFGLNFTSNTLNLFHRYSLSLPGISGPRQIQHFQSAQYFPTVSGGEPPYRYEWQYRKCTSGPNCTGWSPWEERSDYWVASWNCSESRIELALRVTDARLWTRTTWIEIYLSGGGSCT